MSTGTQSSRGETWDETKENKSTEESRLKKVSAPLEMPITNKNLDLKVDDKTLNLYLHNVQSLNNKIPDIEVVLNSDFKHINILCLTEHWVNGNNIGIIRIPNFQLATSFCRETYQHGGTAIFIKKGIKFQPIHKFDYLNIEKTFEFCAVEITEPHVIIICLYHSPDGDTNIFLNNLEKLVNAVKRVRNDIIVCGDFNIDFLVDSKNKQQLLDFTETQYLQPIVSQPTRITKTSKTSLDQIFMVKNKYTYCLNVFNPGFSDHEAVLLKMCLGKVIQQKDDIKTTKRRSFTDENVYIFNQLLCNTSWDSVYEPATTNDKYNTFHDLYLYFFDIAFPLKFSKNRTNKKLQWITPGIIISSHRKRFLSRYYKTHNVSVEFEIYFKKYTSIYNKVIAQAKRMANDQYIAQSKNKIKAMWNVVKTETCNEGTTRNNITLSENGNKICNPSTVADAFNKYFTNIAEKLTKDIPINTKHTKNLKSQGNISSLFFHPVTHEEVYEAINELKNKYSTGVDGIPDIVIKKSAAYILEPLVHIFNHSLTTGTFPDRLKVSKVKPLFKKGRKDLLESYRPVSIPLGFCKILEKLVYKRVLSFLVQNNIISDSQHGFRNNRSTESAIYNYLDSILKSLDGKEIVSGIFLDLSKAFDLINHKILLEKLEHYGIRGVAHDWFKSYINSREQITEISHEHNDRHIISNHLSALRKVRQGVPQGSILGPLLFILYMNDLEENLICNDTVLFADDTSILIKGSDEISAQNLADRTLKDLSEWFSINRLLINMTKTVYINFYTTQNKQPTNLKLTINQDTIKHVDETKFLGLHIQKNLKWESHTNSLNLKLSKACYVLRILKGCTNEQTVRNAYFGYFHSVMRYGIIFWGRSPSSQNIFKTQKRAIRVLKGARTIESCRPLFRAYKILPLPSVYILDTIAFVIKNKGNNSYIFHENTEVHSHNTRRKYDLHSYPSRTTINQMGVFQTGIKLYNKLPERIKLISTENKFRAEVKAFLMEHCFYSVDEYLEM